MQPTNATTSIATGFGLVAAVFVAANALPATAGATEMLHQPPQEAVVNVPLTRTLGLKASEAEKLLVTVRAQPDLLLEERRRPSARQVGTLMRALRAERRAMTGAGAQEQARTRVEHGREPDGGCRAAGQPAGAFEILDDVFLMAESVIGQDTREQVSDTTQYPFRAVGLILTAEGTGCTGTLIGPRHVLTAAHCVYDIEFDQWYSGITFSPGQNGQVNPFGTFGVQTVLALDGYVVEHRSDFDIAMLILDHDIGEQVGWMGFATDEFDQHRELTIDGYPGDKPAGTMWHAFCPLEIAQLARLYYGCDTFGGMSGSAVYGPTEQDIVVLGVHVQGVDSTGLNSATRINDVFFEVLLAWKQSN